MKQIAVIGSSECTTDIYNDAIKIGKLIAKKGHILITGGRGGIPSINKSEANRYCDIVLPTGIGEMRNFLIIRSADIVIAIDGGYGTLSEISIAKKMDKKLLIYKPSYMVSAICDNIHIINSIAEICSIL
jgi:predicted Rossmann-fold nucleotide-binding protein